MNKKKVKSSIRIISKVIFLIFIIFLLSSFKINIYATAEDIISKQADILDIQSFLDVAKENTKETLGEINYSEIFTNLSQGKIEIIEVFPSIKNILKNELQNVLKTITTIFVIVLIHGIFKTISENLGNDSIGKIAYFVQYIVIIIYILETYSDLVIYVKDTIERLIDYTNILIPILMTLIMSTGNITTVSIIEPILLVVITFIGNFIINILIPILLIGTVLSIASNLSPNISAEKISIFLKSSTIWILGFILTVFTGILSLQSVLTKNVDEVTIKATKNIVSSAVPVVGKVLSDTTETVLGCAVILKNSVGIIGIIVIIGITIIPLIKILSIMISFYLASGICQLVADEKIVKVLSQMGDTFKILLGMLAAVTAMLIIGTSIVIKITASG